mmetsp:Transcript_96300/g.272245  ORF Transcript_96300/g.272245 Transcript_96300/m.272245 type:complete len:217 (-) Transcript_96300:542-1192(-)
MIGRCFGSDNATAKSNSCGRRGSMKYWVAPALVAMAPARRCGGPPAQGPQEVKTDALRFRQLQRRWSLRRTARARPQGPGVAGRRRRLLEEWLPAMRSAAPLQATRRVVPRMRVGTRPQMPSIRPPLPLWPGCGRFNPSSGTHQHRQVHDGPPRRPPLIPPHQQKCARQAEAALPHPRLVGEYSRGPSPQGGRLLAGRHPAPRKPVARTATRGWVL